MSNGGADHEKFSQVGKLIYWWNWCIVTEKQLKFKKKERMKERKEEDTLKEMITLIVIIEIK